MKQILCVLAISLVVFSCAKKSPENTLPETDIAFNRAWDSMKFQYNTFYHVVLNRANVRDSSAAIVFLSSASNSVFVKEYKIATDTNGMHLLDSSSYPFGTTYSEYQDPHNNYHASSVGYIFTKYNPIGGTTNNFSVHDHLTTDTLLFKIGTPVSSNTTTGTLIRPTTDTVTSMYIYQ